MENSKNNSKSEEVAVKVSCANIVCNAALSMIKLFAGIFAYSGAMISDAINSISDVFSSVIVIIGVKVANKESDREHQYGHERFECVTEIILAIILLVTALFIGHEGIELIVSGKYKNIKTPKLFALYVAGISIVMKEIMFTFTFHYAKKLKSSALKGVAWDNQSDVLLTSCVFISIITTRFGFPRFDVISRLIIALLILKVAYGIFKDSIGKMVDRSCSEEFEKEILSCVLEVAGVMSVDLLKTRVFGNKIYVDVEIGIDAQTILEQSHEIAQGVHNVIESRFSDVKHIMVHVNPFRANPR